MISQGLGLEESDISKERITGHYGNEIISVKAHIIGPKAQTLARKIVDSLSKEAKSSIRAEIEKSLDEHDSLFLRLDRQSFGGSSVSLSDDEPIRIKLKPKGRTGGRDSMIAHYEELIR
jgi:RNA binding exosome subunit